MEKVDFKYLFSFKYNNKDYLFLTSKSYPFYFVEYNKNSHQMILPDVETYLDLYEKFQNSYLFSIKGDIRKIKTILSDIVIKLPPYVRTVSGLLAISMALSLCGCTQTPDKSIPESASTEITEVQNEYSDVLNYFNNYNIHVTPKNYNEENYYFVNDCIGKSGTKQIYLKNNEEFRSLVGLDFIPTYEDVKKSFEGNKNIPDELKNIILNALDNLKNSKDFETLDLSVLYINSKRMSFKYMPFDVLSKKVNNENVYAYFDTYTGEVCLPEDLPFREFEFIHEVLGHGALAYRNHQDDVSYIYDGTSQIMIETGSRYTGYMIGTMIEEGGANIIARSSVSSTDTRTFYELFEEEIRVIARLCHMTTGELLNHRGENLYDIMYQNNITNPVDYIINTDLITKGVVYTSFSTLLETLIVDGTAEEFLLASDKEKEEIIESGLDIILASNFKDGLHYKYPDGIIDYDPVQTANNYKKSMDELKR